MNGRFDPADNYARTMRAVGYVTRQETTPEIYRQLGFKCGLEIHQQLRTQSKLFCRCPAGLYQKEGEYDAEVVRHMRPTLSELGEYDGTALMEFKTRKNVIYRIKYETACTYDIDDTPPFPVDREAMEIGIKIALMLKLNIVGELHITRKQYLDGSIPTGFQRTGIIGIDGEIPLPHKKVRIMQLSIEEDACREVSDVGHWRVYTTDRLGMPLVETVTYPDLLTPDEAFQAAQYLRFLARSSGKVRVGIGAAREDVNVSVSGGTRVEIKGVAHIRWIPNLVHNEAFRQRALLLIRDELQRRVGNPTEWAITHEELDVWMLPHPHPAITRVKARGGRVTAINLPQFHGILSHFTQPGKMFADELCDRLKVIACLEKPNLMHSEQAGIEFAGDDLTALRRLLNAGEDDAQLVIWGPAEDIATALETIEERCRLAMQGVPNETRKALPDGTNLFERVLPGPDRMYPDTDSAPIPIPDELIERKRQQLPVEVVKHFEQLRSWGVPEDADTYILRNNLVSLIKRIVEECEQEPRYIATFFAHRLKNIEGKTRQATGFSYERVYDLFSYVKQRHLSREVLEAMLPVVYEHPNMDLDSVLLTINFHSHTEQELMAYVPPLIRKFRQIRTTENSGADLRWIMGHLRKRALGNLPLAKLSQLVQQELQNG